MIHFLLAVVAVALVGIHVILLHRQSPSFSASDVSDGSETLSGILGKDLAVTFVVVGLIFVDSTKGFVHPDN